MQGAIAKIAWRMGRVLDTITRNFKRRRPGEVWSRNRYHGIFKKLGTDIVSHNVHWAYGPHQQTTHGMQSYLKGVSDGFHTFAVEWMPDKYIFYVDGYKFYEVTQGISNIDEYMILSMEYPSLAEEISKTVFPDVFIVDYVRVYQKK